MILCLSISSGIGPPLYTKLPASFCILIKRASNDIIGSIFVPLDHIYWYVCIVVVVLVVVVFVVPGYV